MCVCVCTINACTQTLAVIERTFFCRDTRGQVTGSGDPVASVDDRNRREQQGTAVWVQGRQADDGNVSSTWPSTTKWIYLICTNLGISFCYSRQQLMLQDCYQRREG